MYQNVTEEKIMFFDTKIWNSSEKYFLEPGLYHSTTVIVEALNTIYQEIHNHTEISIAVKVSRRTQKVEIHLAYERSGLASFSSDLGYIFGSNVGNDFRVLLKRKRPHKPVFAYDIVRIHFFNIYTAWIEYKIDADTKAPLLRYFLFISKLKSGDILSTGHYMNYQTFSKLQFRPLLKIFFHIIHQDLKDTSVDKIPLYLWVLLDGYDVWKSLQSSFLTENTLQDGCFKTSKQVLC